MEHNIHRAKQLIQYHLRHPAALPAIAERLNISYHTLRKQFAKVEGIPMNTYQQRERLIVARRLLLNRHIAIYQITNALGFSANSNFTRWFKQYTGITPSEYRRQNM